MSEMHFCASCGAERKPGSKFCASCGARFDAEPVAVSVAAPLSQPAQQTQASWHVVVGDQLPRFEPTSASVASAPPVGTSLRGPALTAGIMTLIDIWISSSANTAASGGNNWRLWLAGAVVVLGLIAGSRRGPLSKLMLVASAGLGIVQSLSVYGALPSLNGDPSKLISGLLSLSPRIVSAISAFKAAFAARK